MRRSLDASATMTGFQKDISAWTLITRFLVDPKEMELEYSL